MGIKGFITLRWECNLLLKKKPNQYLCNVSTRGKKPCEINLFGFYIILYVYIYIYIYKVGGRSRGRHEGFLFNNYYTEGSGRALLLSLDCSTLLLFHTWCCRVLSKEKSSIIFWVFGMSWPEIERAIRKHSNHYVNGLVYICIYHVKEKYNQNFNVIAWFFPIW